MDREKFIEIVEMAIEQKQSIRVTIEMPGMDKPEKITNPAENVPEKMKYYLKAYDDEMRLINNQDIKIIQVKCLDKDDHIDIVWQEGTEKEVGINGAQIVDVLEVALNRLQTLNSQYPCRENALAVTKIEEAIMWQNARTSNREKRGVEGTYQK